MTATDLQHDQRIPPVRSAPGSVDRKTNVIRGAKVMQLGDLALGDSREVYVDVETLRQVEFFGNAYNKGLKARWTHPNMSGDGLGKYLGRFQNFRIVADSVLADLYLADVAFDTPAGDLASWVLEMAESDPEAFGVSVAGVWDELAMADIEPRPDGKRPIRFSGIRAADVVDDPAATRGGLFSIDSKIAIPAQITWLLNTHFADSEPVEVARRAIGLLGKYYGKNLMAELQTEPVAEETAETENEIVAEALDTEPETAEPETAEPVAVDLAAVSEAAAPYVDAFGAEGAQAFLEGKTLLECYQDALETVSAMADELAAENDELRERLDAAVSIAGEPDELSASIEDDVPESRRAIAAKAKELETRGASPTVAKFGAALAARN